MIDALALAAPPQRLQHVAYGQMHQALLRVDALRLSICRQGGFGPHEAAFDGGQREPAVLVARLEIEAAPDGRVRLREFAQLQRDLALQAQCRWEVGGLCRRMAQQPLRVPGPAHAQMQRRQSAQGLDMSRVRAKNRSIYRFRRSSVAAGHRPACLDHPIPIPIE